MLPGPSLTWNNACAGEAAANLVYARAATNSRPPADAAVWTVPLEVASGRYEGVISSRVYSFRSGAGRYHPAPGMIVCPVPCMCAACPLLYPAQWSCCCILRVRLAPHPAANDEQHQAFQRRSGLPSSSQGPLARLWAEMTLRFGPFIVVGDVAIVSGIGGCAGLKGLSR